MRVVILSLMILIVTACSTTPVISPTPTEIETASPTITPTATNTPAPTVTSTPTPTKTPSPTPTLPSGAEIWVAFVGNNELDQPVLIVGNLTTGQYQVLDTLGEFPKDEDRSFTEAFSVSWSPDGKALLYTSSNGDRIDLNIIDLQSGEKRKLVTLPKGLVIHSFDWQPQNGKWVAYQLKQFWGGNYLPIWIVNIESGDSLSVLPKASYGDKVSWSVDGNHLYLGGTQPALWNWLWDYDLEKHRKTDIKGVKIGYNLEINGKISRGWYGDACCGYLPQSDSLIYQAIYRNDQGEDKQGIFFLPRNGSSAKMIYEKNPGWHHNSYFDISVSPNGRYLYFGKNFPLVEHYLYTLADGNVELIYTEGDEACRGCFNYVRGFGFIDWGPDSNTFAALTAHNPLPEISIYDSATLKRVIAYIIPVEYYPITKQALGLSTGIDLYWENTPPTIASKTESQNKPILQFTSTAKIESIQKIEDGIYTVLMQYFGDNLAHIAPVYSYGENFNNNSMVSRVGANGSPVTVPFPANIPQNHAGVFFFQYIPGTSFYLGIPAKDDGQFGFSFGNSAILEITYGNYKNESFVSNYPNRPMKGELDFRPNRLYGLLASMDHEGESRVVIWDALEPEYSISFAQNWGQKGTVPAGTNQILTIWRSIYKGQITFYPHAVFPLSPNVASNVNSPPQVLEWGFSNNDNSEEWVPINHLEPFRVQNGFLFTTSTGDDPYMHSNPVWIDTQKYNRVEVRMKVSRGSGASIYFIRDTDQYLRQLRRIDG